MPNYFIEIFFMSLTIVAFVLPSIAEADGDNAEELTNIKSIFEFMSLLGFFILILMNDYFEKYSGSTSLKFKACEADIVLLALNLIINFRVYRAINPEKVFVILISALIGYAVYLDKGAWYKALVVFIGFLSIFISIFELNNLRLRNIEVAIIFLVTMILTIVMAFMPPLTLP